MISGDSNGNIIVWARGTNTICKFIRGVHDGSIFSICVLKEGSIISGGGKDNRIVQLDADLTPTGMEGAVSKFYKNILTLFLDILSIIFIID